MNIQAIMTVLLSLLSASSRFACSGHSLRTLLRGDVRAPTGCKKKKFEFVHLAHNLVHCTWSVYFRAIPSLSAPAWAQGQPDTTPGPIPSDDRGTSCDTPADLASLGSAARKSIPTRRLATGLERWNHSFRRSRRKVSAPCVINRY